MQTNVCIVQEFSADSVFKEERVYYYTIRTEVTIYHAALKSIRALNSVGFQESPNEGRWVGPPALGLETELHLVTRG